VNLVYPVQFGDKWRSFVNKILKFRVPIYAETSYLDEAILVSQQWLCSVELTDWLVGWLVGCLVS
jgi:hypothetical protein